MQTAEKGVYSGALDVVRKTVAREGLRKVGHWRPDEEESFTVLIYWLSRASMQVYPRRS